MIKTVFRALINLFSFKNQSKNAAEPVFSSCKQTNLSRKKPKKSTRKKNYPKNNK